MCCRRQCAPSNSSAASPGIGLVAMGQATLIVGFALAVATAVGSDLLHGRRQLVLACESFWLILGYSFYCWVLRPRLDGRAPGSGADACPTSQHSHSGWLHLLDPGELG